MTHANPLSVPGLRTRLNVVADRLMAGMPFYWDATDAYVAPEEPNLTFLGVPCWILDRDGDHLVLQRKEATQ